MSYVTSKNLANTRISMLLDEGSFVEIGGAITARATDFNMQEKETPADGVVTGYGLIDGRVRTLEEVGEEFQITRERIRQIEAKAIRKLRQPGSLKSFKDFGNGE